MSCAFSLSCRTCSLCSAHKDTGITNNDTTKDLNFKAKARTKDLTFKAKDRTKDCISVLKDNQGPRPRTISLHNVYRHLQTIEDSAKQMKDD